MSYSGIAMAITAGLLFGLNFCPVIYIQQHSEKYPTASSNGNSLSTAAISYLSSAPPLVNDVDTIL